MPEKRLYVIVTGRHPYEVSCSFASFISCSSICSIPSYVTSSYQQNSCSPLIFLEILARIVSRISVCSYSSKLLFVIPISRAVYIFKPFSIIPIEPMRPRRSSAFDDISPFCTWYAVQEIPPQAHLLPLHVLQDNVPL